MGRGLVVLFLNLYWTNWIDGWGSAWKENHKLTLSLFQDGCVDTMFVCAIMEFTLLNMV